jgi:hypothetical protein
MIEADIQSYFDSIDRTKLKEMVRQRVADESMLRHIGKCLHVGILDGAEYSEPEGGTVQGSALNHRCWVTFIYTTWSTTGWRPKCVRDCAAACVSSATRMISRSDSSWKTMRVG